MNKKELQEKLKDKKINFDPKATKKELEKLLSEDIKVDGIVLNTTSNADTSIGNLHIKDTVEEEFLVDKYEASYISKGRTFIVGTYATIKDCNVAFDMLGAYNRKIKRLTK